MVRPTAPAGPIPFRRLLPREHGAWTFLLLPIATGLLARPSWAGAGVALGALAVFVGRGPFQAGSRGRPWVLVLASLGCAGFGTGVWRGGWAALLPLAGAALLGLPLYRRTLKEMRNLVSEGLALLACAALLSAILGAGGATLAEGFRAWLLLVLVALPPLVNLRHRLALGRPGKSSRPSLAALGVHLGATLLACGLWQARLISGLVPMWTLLLLLRGFQTQPASARRLGWTEAVVSLGHLAVLWVSLSGL